MWPTKPKELPTPLYRITTRCFSAIGFKILEINISPTFYERLFNQYYFPNTNCSKHVCAKNQMLVKSPNVHFTNILCALIPKALKG